MNVVQCKHQLVRAHIQSLCHLSALSDRSQCYRLVTIAMAQRPIPHAGNILINLDDDSATLDGDSSTLIRNEAIELHDEWRGRKFVST